MIRCDVFICNPPFGDKNCSYIGKEIVKRLLNNKAVLICGPTNIVSNNLTKITSFENQDFPNIDYGTGIFTLNIGETLYKKHYRLKTSKKSDYWVKVYGLHNKTFEHLKIKNNDKTEECNRFYLDINEEDYIKLNEILTKEEENYKDWLKMYSKQLRSPQWIYADIFYKYGYKNLVEEVQ